MERVAVTPGNRHDGCCGALALPGAPGEVCAVPQVRRTYRWIFWIVAALVLVAFAFPYVVPYFY